MYSMLLTVFIYANSVHQLLAVTSNPNCMACATPSTDCVLESGATMQSELDSGLAGYSQPAGTETIVCDGDGCCTATCQSAFSSFICGMASNLGFEGDSTCTSGVCSIPINPTPQPTAAPNTPEPSGSPIPAPSAAPTATRTPSQSPDTAQPSQSPEEAPDSTSQPTMVPIDTGNLFCPGGTDMECVNKVDDLLRDKAAMLGALGEELVCLNDFCTITCNGGQTNCDIVAGLLGDALDINLGVVCEDTVCVPQTVSLACTRAVDCDNSAAQVGLDDSIPFSCEGTGQDKTCTIECANDAVCETAANAINGAVGTNMDYVCNGGGVCEYVEPTQAPTVEPTQAPTDGQIVVQPSDVLGGVERAFGYMVGVVGLVVLAALM